MSPDLPMESLTSVRRFVSVTVQASPQCARIAPMLLRQVRRVGRAVDRVDDRARRSTRRLRSCARRRSRATTSTPRSSLRRRRRRRRPLRVRRATVATVRVCCRSVPSLLPRHHRGPPLDVTVSPLRSRTPKNMVGCLLPSLASCADVARRCRCSACRCCSSTSTNLVRARRRDAMDALTPAHVARAITIDDFALCVTTESDGTTFNRLLAVAPARARAVSSASNRANISTTPGNGASEGAFGGACDARSRRAASDRRWRRICAPSSRASTFSRVGSPGASLVVVVVSCGPPL